MKVLLAHAGLQYAGRLAEELERRGRLWAFWSGTAIREGSLVERLGRGIVPRAIASRCIGGGAGGLLRGGPWFDLVAVLAQRAGVDYQRAMYLRNGAFQRLIPRRALVGADAVIGFDTSSWILARRCREMGRPFLLDQSIAHPTERQRVFEALARTHPEWSETWMTRRPEVLAAETEEHCLADRVVAASAFTKVTLIENGVGADKIRVNPYGVDIERFQGRPRANASGPVHFIFVGSLLARKGVPFLIDAWRRLASRGAELRLVGPVAPQVRRLIPELPGLRVMGPVPHADLPNLFSECDVFVFPSLFEGFGLVILEAMACGLPVITTEATAGPDVMTDGKEGFLIPSGDVNALDAKMRWCLENRDRLPEMGRAARATAERFTWEAYGDRWEVLLNEAVAEFGLRSSEIGN